MIEINNQLLKNFKFIDLFAGIGGFHIALESFGAKCVFASEIDNHSIETYYENHGIIPKGDITKINESFIPNHDILCAGFPCQSFSISGKQKGFEDSRGTLFFDIARIASYHKPKVLFLENVKNLERHDNGKTLRTILSILEDMNYKVFYEVLNTSNYGLPQNRERIYIVAFSEDTFINEFNFPKIGNIQTCLEDILEENPTNAKVIYRNDINIYKEYNLKKNIFNEYDLPNTTIQIGKVNKGGQGERIYHSKGHSVTLSAYGGGVGSKTGLYQINGKIRKLSPRECARLQGFPDTFKLNKSVSQAYKQFGNSVSINVLQYILIEISNALEYNVLSKKYPKELKYG